MVGWPLYRESRVSSTFIPRYLKPRGRYTFAWDTAPSPASWGSLSVLIYCSGTQRALEEMKANFHSVKEPNSWARFVRVMLMKVVAAVSDLGSTPSSSTKVPEVLVHNESTHNKIVDLLIGFRNSGGAAMVSTGLNVVTGGIWVGEHPAVEEETFFMRLPLRTAQNIIAKPMTMAAAA